MYFSSESLKSRKLVHFLTCYYTKGLQLTDDHINSLIFPQALGCLFFFPLVMRTFEIYSLSNVYICNTVLLTIINMLYISVSWLIYFITVIFYLWTPFTYRVPFYIAHPHPVLSQKRFKLILILTCLFFC